MTTSLLSNSAAQRDIETVLHPQTNLRRHMSEGPTLITGGDGIFVHDDRGNAILDSGAGLWCSSLGFKSERLAKVAYEAMRNMGYFHMFRGASHQAVIELSDKLIALAPVPMSKVLYQSSGSEANDGALKLVWYHWNAEGKSGKRKIISRKGSYHGSTCATISLTGKPEYHKGFGPPLRWLSVYGLPELLSLRSIGRERRSVRPTPCRQP